MYLILFLTKLVIFIVGMCNNVNKYYIHKLANIKINLKVNRPPTNMSNSHVISFNINHYVHGYLCTFLGFLYTYFNKLGFSSKHVTGDEPID